MNQLLSLQMYNKSCKTKSSSYLAFKKEEGYKMLDTDNHYSEPNNKIAKINTLCSVHSVLLFYLKQPE